MLARCFGWIALVAVLGMPGIALAITIGFEPSSQVVPLGDPAQVELRISDLGSSAAPSLGVFDLIVSFDPSILSFSALSFGDPMLGDQLDPFSLGSLTDVDAGLAGAIRIFELSLDLPTDLDTLQAAAFTLATLTFDTLQVGTSPLQISLVSLGDAHGAPLFATLEDGSVSVVPEPRAALAFLVGLLFVRRATRLRAGAR